MKLFEASRLSSRSTFRVNIPEHGHISRRLLPGEFVGDADLGERSRTSSAAAGFNFGFAARWRQLGARWTQQHAAPVSPSSFSSRACPSTQLHLMALVLAAMSTFSVDERLRQLPSQRPLASSAFGALTGCGDLVAGVTRSGRCPSPVVAIHGWTVDVVAVSARRPVSVASQHLFPESTQRSPTLILHDADAHGNAGPTSDRCSSPSTRCCHGCPEACRILLSAPECRRRSP